MRWLLMLVVVCVWATVEGNQASLQCPSVQGHTCSKNRSGRYFIDRQRIVIKASSEKFIVKCGGANVLESPALPKFSNKFSVLEIELVGCPLPQSKSFAEVFSAFNVALEHADDKECTLALIDFPTTSKLTTQQFTGLDHLIALEIKTESEITINTNIFTELHSLRSLKMTRVSTGSDLESLVAQLPTVQKLQLVNWQQKQLTPLRQCGKLEQLDLYKPSVEKLPDSWVAACPNLGKITLKNAENLEALPPKLLEGANTLIRFIISKLYSTIDSLPEGFLEGAPNLIAFEMSHSRLKNLSSGMFRGPSLLTLNLNSNRLSNEAINAVTGITTLIKLDIGNNYDISDLCEANGHSILRNLNQLKELSLKQTSITRICPDWRNDMIFLEELNLEETDIQELTFADLQYTREEMVKSASVILDGAPISTIRFTEEEYNTAMRTPHPAGPVRTTFDSDALDCDCRMYWTRKTLEIASFKTVFDPDQLRCKDSIRFMRKSPGEICPERATA